MYKKPDWLIEMDEIKERLAGNYLPSAILFLIEKFSFHSDKASTKDYP